MPLRHLLLTALCVGTGCALLAPAPALAAKTDRESSADLRKKEAQQKKWEANYEKNVKKNALSRQRHNLENMHKVLALLKSIRTPEQAEEKCEALWKLTTETDLSNKLYYDYSHAPTALRKEYYATRREYNAQRHRLIESGIADAAGSKFTKRLQFCGTRWTDDWGTYDWPRCTWEETLAKRQAGTEEEIDKKWLQKNSEKHLAAGLQCSMEAYRKGLEILRSIHSREDAMAQKEAIREVFRETWQGVNPLDHEEIPEPYNSEYIHLRDESRIEFYRICKEGLWADDPRYEITHPYSTYISSCFGENDTVGAWIEEFHNFPPGDKPLREPAPPPTRAAKKKKKAK